MTSALLFAFLVSAFPVVFPQETMITSSRLNMTDYYSHQFYIHIVRSLNITFSSYTHQFFSRMVAEPSCLTARHTNFLNSGCPGSSRCPHSTPIRVEKGLFVDTTVCVPSVPHPPLSLRYYYMFPDKLSGTFDAVIYDHHREMERTGRVSWSILRSVEFENLILVCNSSAYCGYTTEFCLGDEFVTTADSIEPPVNLALNAENGFLTFRMPVDNAHSCSIDFYFPWSSINDHLPYTFVLYHSMSFADSRVFFDPPQISDSSPVFPVSPTLSMRCPTAAFRPDYCVAVDNFTSNYVQHRIHIASLQVLSSLVSDAGRILEYFFDELAQFLLKSADIVFQILESLLSKLLQRFLELTLPPWIFTVIALSLVTYFRFGLVAGVCVAIWLCLCYHFGLF